MGIEVPAAHIHDDRTGEYRVVNEADAATSGGDIGAQVPIFPVVWVSDRDDRALSHTPFFQAADVPLPQVKGTDKYHGGRRDTMVRENVLVQHGWVTSSGNRREYLFAQLNEDMSREGVENYEKLNNLGAHACALLHQLRLLPRASHL
tara:strand:- start:596 stop:1039 length:444 start_codon:yes stop_codon:yes gene_type:complete